MFRPQRLLVRDTLLAIPAAVIATMASATNEWPTRPDSVAVQIGFGAYAIAVLMFRRTYPVATWAIAVIGAAVTAPLVLRAEPSQVVLAFGLYSLLATSDRVEPIKAAAVSYAAALGGTLLMDVQLDHGIRVDTFLMPALTVMYGAGLGAVVRVNRRTAADLAERNEELLALNEVARREAVLAERSRIARELHDIVAHHVSGMVLHARAARDAIDRQPQGVDSAGARDALHTIAESGSEALGSMRGLLSILRDGELDLAPQPELGDLGSLVDSMAARGLPTTLDLVGPPRQAPPDVQLSAYRIVQEALTNASRHAHAQRCAVTVSWEAHGVHLTIDDNGVGPDTGYREGHGIVGMRERAALVGGSVTVGRSPSGGWRVDAHLPVAPVPAAADVVA
ncbi:MAG: sensor histidine kinase [Actinobacteria bacterium]|nr:sensor histidine kinase [Actinomycetota bacterium]